MVFPLVLEFDLLIYVESDGIGCSFLILLFMCIDFEADVVGLYMSVSAYFVKPYGRIRFQ